MGSSRQKFSSNIKQVKNLILCPSAYAPQIGGVEELTKNLASNYQKNGLKVSIFTSKPNKSKSQEIIAGIPVYRFNFFLPAKNIWQLLRFIIFAPLEILRLLRLTKKIKPDILHIQCNGSNTWYIYLLSKITGIPLVDTLQGETIMDEQQIYQKSAFARYALHKVLQQASLVTACSNATLKDGLKYCNFAKKANRIFNGINFSEFQIKTKKLKANYIFATGRFTHNKGFDLLIAAFKNISVKHPQLQLFIGGDGKTRAAAEEYIRINNLTAKVKLLGRLDRLQTVTYMRNALFVVMPSRYEPFGIVALEALAAGKTILATKYGGPPEFINKQIGLLVDPINEKDLTKKLNIMLNIYPQLEKDSRKFAKYFDWQIIVKNYLEIYQRAINK